MSLLKYLRPHSSTHVPLHLRYAITIMLVLRRAPHSQLFNKLRSTSIALHYRSLFHIPLLLHLLSLLYLYFLPLCIRLNQFYLSSHSCFFLLFSRSFCIVSFYLVVFFFKSFFFHFFLIFYYYFFLSLSPLSFYLSLSLLPFLLPSLPIFYLSSSYRFCSSTQIDAPLRISYAIAISLALTRPPHFQLFLSFSPFLPYGIFSSCYLPFNSCQFSFSKTHIHSLSSSLFTFFFISSIMPPDRS